MNLKVLSSEEKRNLKEIKEKDNEWNLESQILVSLINQ